ncbi:MAG TPA: hypothetical protein VM911_16710, partial [Pyrinomonadaceae bacterium]|nr:hypothetical protein [Pyrinomonadaceae bacterium]
MQYQINISIDSAGLQSIYNTGQYVTFVKSVLTSPLAGGNLPIAWISFQPLEENQVTWIENYYIYTTTTMLQSGATISMTSQTGEPVQTGWTYTFAHGQFTGAAGGGQGTFNVSDQMTGANFNFGLAQ